MSIVGSFLSMYYKLVLLLAMKSSCCAFLLLAMAVVTSAGKPKWNTINCKSVDKAAKVKDVMCCHDEHCYEQTNEADCEAQPTCLWQESTKKGKAPRCLPNRDDDGKVCCLTATNQDCDDIMEGKCPVMYQVSQSIHMLDLICLPT